MHKSIEDFLAREEKRRNRSLTKAFMRWLETDRAVYFLDNLERVLSKKGGEYEAVKLLLKAEETAKSDQVFKRKDNARKKAIQKFQSEFEKWLKTDDGLAYTKEIEHLLSRDDLDETLRQNKIQEMSDEAEQAFIQAHPHFISTTASFPKSRIRAYRRAYSQNVDQVVLNVIEPGLKQLGFVSTELVKNWSKIVGPAVSLNSRAEKIMFPPKSRTHGKLIISVRAGFNTEIQHQRDEIVHRVNAHFGFKAVSDIQISKKPFDSFTTPGQKTSRYLISRNITPKDNPTQHASGLISKVTDPRLKSALNRLGCVINARNNG